MKVKRRCSVSSSVSEGGSNSHDSERSRPWDSAASCSLERNSSIVPLTVHVAKRQASDFKILLNQRMLAAHVLSIGLRSRRKRGIWEKGPGVQAHALRCGSLQPGLAKVITQKQFFSFRVKLKKHRGSIE